MMYNNVTGGGTETKTENWSTGDGWQYRVYHKNGNTYVRDNSTESLSPSAYRLVNTDYVKWCYCDYTEVNSYFPASFAATP